MGNSRFLDGILAAIIYTGSQDCLHEVEYSETLRSSRIGKV